MVNTRNSVYRERFRWTLEHKPVDRPPMDLASTDMTEIFGGPRRLARYLGIESQGRNPDDIDETVLHALDIDIRGVGGILLRPEPPAGPFPVDIMNAWGIRCRYNGHECGYERIGTPLKGAFRYAHSHIHLQRMCHAFIISTGNGPAGGSGRTDDVPPTPRISISNA